MLRDVQGSIYQSWFAGNVSAGVLQFKLGSVVNIIRDVGFHGAETFAVDYYGLQAPK